MLPVKLNVLALIPVGSCHGGSDYLQGGAYQVRSSDVTTAEGTNGDQYAQLTQTFGGGLTFIFFLSVN